MNIYELYTCILKQKKSKTSAVARFLSTLLFVSIAIFGINIL